MKKIQRKECLDYELILEWKETLTGEIRINYAQDSEGTHHAILQIAPDGVKMLVQTPDGEQVLKHDPHVPYGKVLFTRRGNYARARYGSREMWLQGGTGEWYGHYMAEEAVLTVEDRNDELTGCIYSSLEWLKAPEAPVVSAGEDGTFYEQQIIGGAVIEHEGIWYMYCMSGVKGTEEGAADRVIGLCTSPDLNHWTVHPEPLIAPGILGVKGENLYPNACIKTEDGKFVLFFSAQAFPQWIGVYAMISDSPAGPFTLLSGEPVIPPLHGRAQHEFDLVKCDLPQGKYLLYLTTFTPGDGKRKPGDRGLLYFSDDLLNWRMDKEIGMFHPETSGGWDCEHVRTRSLTRIGDTWYLWYEGVGYWRTPKSDYENNSAFVNHEWWDTVGLARSKDLRNWEYYPRNPCLVQQGQSADRYDNRWVGWPRMVITDGKGYVFHSASGTKVHVGLRTIEIDRLTDWDNEGGFKEILL